MEKIWHFLLEYALKVFEYMLKVPITMARANKFCVEGNLSGSVRENGV